MAKDKHHSTMGDTDALNWSGMSAFADQQQETLMAKRVNKKALKSKRTM